MKAVISSLMFLSNKKTIFTHFVLTPIINILFIITINNQFVSEISSKLIVTTLLTSMVISIITNINSSLVYDYNNDILSEVIVENKYNSYYWMTKIIIISIIAYIILFINSCFIMLIGIDLSIVKQLLIMSPIITINALIVGIAISIIGLNFNNPYFLTNIISLFSYVFFGAIGPYILYPVIFKISTFLFPFARILNYVLIGKGGYIWIDILISFLWLLILFSSYNYTMKNIKRNGKKNMI